MKLVLLFPTLISIEHQGNVLHASPTPPARFAYSSASGLAHASLPSALPVNVSSWLSSAFWLLLKFF